MSLFNVFNVAGSALNAQTVRLNVTASNLANANTASSTPEGTYHARHPVFSTLVNDSLDGREATGVRVVDILESKAAPIEQYQPDNPLANDKGYVYFPKVNGIEELANMISASRTYQSNVEVMNTSKQMLLRTINIGQ
jgi:flagellar basal-body rod protein FlgC